MPNIEYFMKVVQDDLDNCKSTLPMNVFTVLDQIHYRESVDKYYDSGKDINRLKTLAYKYGKSCQICPR